MQPIDPDEGFQLFYTPGGPLSKAAILVAVQRPS
jgi:hypothetical protein